MDCKKFSELLSEFADGELSSAEAAKMKLHMEKCADCRLRYEVIAKMSAEISEICNVSADFEIKPLKSSRLKTLYGRYRHSAALIAAAAAIVIFARGLYGGGIKIKDSAPAPSSSPAPVIDATLGTLPSEGAANDAAENVPQAVAEAPKTEENTQTAAAPQKSAAPKKSLTEKESAEKDSASNKAAVPSPSLNNEAAPAPQYNAPSAAVQPSPTVQPSEKESAETAENGTSDASASNGGESRKSPGRSGDGSAPMLATAPVPLNIFDDVSGYTMPSQELFESAEVYSALYARLLKLKALAENDSVSRETLEADFSALLADISDALLSARK